MNQQPLVSVITPSYNRSAYLSETIKSIISQDYPNIEYIVLDDGSTDNTIELLRKYEGRLKWVSHPNMGETRTVNRGFSMVNGELICVVNSDDPLLPGAVTEMVSFMMDHPDILVAYPDWEMIGPDSKIIRHMRVREYDYIYSVRRQISIVGPGAFMRRRALEVIPGRDPAYKYVADFDFWLRLGLYGKFARVPSTLATFRVHPDSATVSRKGAEMADEYIRMIKKFYSRSDLPVEICRVKSEATSNAYFLAALIHGTDFESAFPYYMRALLINPRSYFSRRKKWRAGFSTILAPFLRNLPKLLCSLLKSFWRK